MFSDKEAAISVTFEFIIIRHLKKLVIWFKLLQIFHFQIKSFELLDN